MPKDPPKQTHLFVYDDITERVICPNCNKLAKAVIAATSVTYIVHLGNKICAIERQRGF